MKIKTFEDCIAWQKAGNLCIQIYKKFGQLKDFTFKDQIIRASISIMNNIAEGFDRNTDKELKQFLYIAKGSCSEVRSMLYLAIKLGYIDNNDFKKIHKLSIEITKLLIGFIKSIKKSNYNNH